MKFKTLLIVITIFAFSFLPSKSDEAIKKKLDPHKYNFYTGMFDFSDHIKNLHFLVFSIRMKIYIEIVL